MSLEYVERRIVEALKQTKGNTVRARQQVIAWAMEDPKLLLSLTKSHLSGIVAYNVERVVSGRAAAARKQQRPAEKKQQQPKAQEKPPVDGPFGVELLKAVADTSSAVFGLEDNGGLSRPKRVSQSHLDAIKAMTSKKRQS